MNKMKFMVLFMSIAMIFGSCGSMNNTGKGAAIGGVRVLHWVQSWEVLSVKVKVPLLVLLSVRQ